MLANQSRSNEPGLNERARELLTSGQKTIQTGQTQAEWPVRETAERTCDIFVARRRSESLTDNRLREFVENRLRESGCCPARHKAEPGHEAGVHTRVHCG